MGLIVENGNGIQNANSYETVAGVISYAANRGITLTPDGAISTATPYIAGGTGGYVVGDVVTVVQQDASAGQLSVLTIDSFGNPTSYLIQQGGVNYISASGMPTIGGTGQNAQVSLTTVGGIITAAVPFVPVVSGYVVNDVLNILQLNGGNGGQVKVLSVSAGVPTSYLVLTPGTSYGTANQLNTTGGSGNGQAQVNITVAFGQVSIWLINGTDYLESYSQQFVGQPASCTQALSWPRMCVQFDPENPFPDDEIPPALIAALDQCVLAQASGINLLPTVNYAATGGFKIEKKVGPIITKFSERIGTTTQPLLPGVMAQLNQLLIPGVALRTVRI
jgi:hypothetical protein